MRGLNCDSEYFLVKTIIKQKLVRTQIAPIKQTKWNQNNLHDPIKLKQYRKCLHTKLNKKEIQHNIEEEWVHIKQTILESAKVIQTQNTYNRNEWRDKECKLIMTQKNDVRKKYLQTRTRASKEIYESKRTEANRICREKKRNWLNNKIKHIEEPNKKQETRKFFKKARFFSKQQPTLPTCCKDKSGNILLEQRDILQRRKKIFL